MTGPDPGATAPPIARGRHGRATSLALIACLFFVVVGGKLAILDHFGSDIPNWDQWDAEGHTLLLPYLQGRLQWADLFTPHNEHRMAPSKLLALGLVLANGQWDSRLECVVNAVLHATFAAAIFGFGCTCIQRRWTAAWFVAVAAFVAPPVAWQNVLGGFHSQQVFVLAFSALAFAFLFRSQTWSPGWWLGIVFAATAIVSQGSGLFVGVVAAALFALRDRSAIARRQHGVTIVACLLLFALGWWLRVEVSYHEQLKARSVVDFTWTVWRSLQWPVRNLAVFPLLAWLPWTWLTWQMIVRRRWADPTLLVIVACGGWTLLNYMAAGYVRGAGGEWPASRYFDTVAFGILANLLALLVAVSRIPLRGWRRWARAGLGFAGVALLAQGLWLELEGTITRELPDIVSRMRAREASTRAYLVTGDRARLDNVDIPYPNADVLAERLSHPEILAILPTSIRPPLPLRTETDPTGNFTAGGVPDMLLDRMSEPKWGSFTAGATGRRGVWRSEPLPAGTNGYWQIRLAGMLDQASIGFAVVRSDDHPITTLTPQPTGIAEWTTVTIRAPKESSRLLARDTDDADWLAFTGPTFLAAGSYRARQLVQQGEVLLATGLLVALGVLGIDALQQRRFRAVLPADSPAGFIRASATAVVVTLTVGCAVAIAAFLWIANRRQPEAWLELQVTTQRETTLQLFVSDGRDRFRGTDSAQAILKPAPRPQPCRLRLPGGVIGKIRFDPAQDDQILSVADLRIVDATGRLLRTFGTDDVIARHQIARLERDGDTLRIVPESGANDPYAELRLAAPLRAAHTRSHLLRTMVGPVGVVLLVGTLAVAALWFQSRRRSR